MYGLSNQSTKPETAWFEHIYLSLWVGFITRLQLYTNNLPLSSCSMGPTNPPMQVLKNMRLYKLWVQLSYFSFQYTILLFVYKIYSHMVVQTRFITSANICIAQYKDFLTNFFCWASCLNVCGFNFLLNFSRTKLTCYFKVGIEARRISGHQHLRLIIKYNSR